MTVTQALLTDDDMDIMRILHQAFRRDAERLAQVADRYGTEDAPAHDALLEGWRGFISSLHHHHSIEDAHIWPAIRTALADRPDDLEVLDAMEAQHARIDPAVAALDLAFADRDEPPASVAAQLMALVDLLRSHLDDEELNAFPLIRRTITKRTWNAINKTAMKERTLADIAQLSPYILEGASAEDVQRVMAELPAPLRLVHRFWWNPRYQKTRRWE